MKWVGHEYDQDVKTSRVDRGYTDYSEEYALQEINKIDYELWSANKINKKRWFLGKNGKNLLPNLFPNITKREKLLWISPVFGATDRTWTDTDFTPRDFKSLVSADSTTVACIFVKFSDFLWIFC